MIPYSLPSSEIIATACRVPLFAPKYKNEIWTKGPTSFCKVWAGVDCLESLALNVSTVFLFRNFVSFKEKTSALCVK